MATIRSFPVAFQTLVTQVRRIMKDPTTFPNGSPRPTSMLKVQDLDIYDKLNDTFIQMQTELDIENEAPSIASMDITYTEDANGDGCELPVGVFDASIIRVEDRSSSNFTRELTPVTNSEIIDWESPLSAQTNQVYPRSAWTVRAAEVPTTNPLKLVIRPTPPAASTFRLYYVAHPLIYVGGSPPADSPSLTSRWRELVATNTACALLSRTGNAPADLIKWNDVLWEQFREFGGRMRAPEHIVSRRDGDY